MKFSLRKRTGILLAAAALLLNLSIVRARQEEPCAAEAMQTGAVQEARILIPGGQAVGVALKTQGVLVVARSLREGAKTALRVGDVILGVQGKTIQSTQELSEQVNALGSDTVVLDVLRSGKPITVRASAPADASDGKRRLGVWVRDSTAGVGTLSYIDPQTGAYGALGHAIVDGDTGEMVSVRDGAILRAKVVGVVRGESGNAGELKGSFLKEGEQIGTLAHNTERGVYGSMEDLPTGLLYPQGLPIGKSGEVKEGPATILSTVDDQGPREYDVVIERCFAANASKQKNMVLRVTDERLIAATGGIVQGMSGSPIIQDGKLVGAVTHVLVNDPTRGYGIFIENMLEAAG